MARKATEYNADTFGLGYVIMPEGNHLFTIERATTSYTGRSPQWELTLQPLDPQYHMKSGKGYRCWVPEDGVVEALFDAANTDPASVDASMDYEPRMFEGKQVYAEVFHKVVKGDDGKDITFANVRRLYPSFSVQSRKSAVENTPAGGASISNPPAQSKLTNDVPF